MSNGLPVVVIDPGHGGTTKTGGSSPNNAFFGKLLEKTLTLDIAQRVEHLVSQFAHVLMTRNRDENLFLADRARVAHDNNADVFLSIHLNGFSDSKVDGTEVWVAANPSSRSMNFAGELLARLVRATGVKDRGVQKKNLGVLLPSRHLGNTAACLTEAVFLTNPDEAKRLQDPAFLDKIAGAMADSIRAFLQPTASAHSAMALDTIVGSGRAELDCPVLRSHRGVATKNLILHWNAPPQSRSTIDVVVHLHGYAGVSSTLDFKRKEEFSGLDFHNPAGTAQPSRQRATLGILPHGDRVDTGNYCGDPCDKYDFPALTGKSAGLSQLIRFSLDSFAAGQLSQPAGSLQPGRLILTAHSGGGARLLLLLDSAHLGDLKLHEVHFFDALYSNPASAIRWVESSIRSDATALASLSASERLTYMRTQGHALRALFRPSKGTTPHNTALHNAIECALGAISDAALRAFLRNFYRVEQTTVAHNDIPKTFGWQWLVDASASVTPPATRLAAPACPAPGARASSADWEYSSALDNAPTSLKMRPKRIRARILWPALGFPAVIEPQEHGSNDPLATSATRGICVLLLSDQPNLGKEDAAQYLRIVPWPQRTRRQIAAGQPGSFRVDDIQVVNDDGGKKLSFPVKDELCDAVVFGVRRGGEKNVDEDAIVVSLSRHVRDFYRKNGLQYLHEIRISEAASAKLAPAQYQLFWDNDVSEGASSDEVQLLLEGFAKPQRAKLGPKWAGMLGDLIKEYRVEYGALHPPYKHDTSEPLTEVLHPVFVRRQIGPLRVAHITDTHVDVRADVYEWNLRGKGKFAGVPYNNNNRNFIKIYAEAKASKADAILLTGDLIDYGRGHVGPLPDGKLVQTLGQDDHYHEDRNWFLFYYLLATGGNYTVPAYTILGNHDWRVNPYPPLAPGAPTLSEVFNVTGLKNIEPLKATWAEAHGDGFQRGFSYALKAETKFQLLRETPGKALLAYFGNLTQDGSPLQTRIESVMWYLLLINPFLNFSVRLPGGQQLLMLDWAKEEEIINPDYPRKEWMEYGPRAAASLTPLQKWQIQQFLDSPGRAKIIGVHAPPLGPFPEWKDSDLQQGVKEYQSSEDSRLRWPDGTIKRATKHPFFAIRPSDAPYGVAADYGSFVHDHDWFIQNVADARHGVRLVLSGHIHRTGRFTASAPTSDRKAWMLRDVSSPRIKILGVRSPAVAEDKDNNKTYLGPLYVNTTSAGPRGNRWSASHTQIDPGWAVMNIAPDGTISDLTQRCVDCTPARTHSMAVRAPDLASSLIAS
jgi:N-acetylmuramoyl-L-alanine amidase/3',5'-cyclic AMP phosphodiesterase CpdA